MNNQTNGTMPVYRFKRFARKSYSVFNSLHKAVTIGVLSGCALMSAHAASVDPVETVHTTSSSDTIPLKELDEVVVTASKTALPLNLATKQVTLITREEMERSPVRSVEELLHQVAGIDILQRGPHGVQADISLRGGSFDQTAILLNGINLTNPHTGHYSFDLPVNLSDIERIEIVQGPSSLVFGAGAFSGGINIITKRDGQSNLSATLEGGMHGLFGGEARGAYKGSSSVHRLSAGYKRSDGYIANSDYKISNLLWQSHFSAEKSIIDFQVGMNDKKQGANTFYTGQFPNQFDDTRAFFASVRGETYGKLKFIPQMYWSRHYDRFELIRNDATTIPFNYHRSDLFGMNLNLQYASTLGITNVGGEIRTESILSSRLGKPLPDPVGKYVKSDSRSNISFFLEQNIVLDRFTFSLGGVVNHNTAYTHSARFYPAVNASFRPSEQWRLYASWNRATRMPTFTELWYTEKTHTGNSKLQAEHSEAFECGVKYLHAVVQGSLSTFYLKGRNMIDWVKEEPEDKWASTNHTVINRKGVEINLHFNLREWFGEKQPFIGLNMGYMYLDQNKAENELISKYALNYLRHKCTANLTHKVTRNLTFSWNYRWQQRMGSYISYAHSKEGERTAFQPFGLLDVKADYRWRHYNFFVNASNLFNTPYMDYGDVPQPGFWLTGGVGVRF